MKLGYCSSGLAHHALMPGLELLVASGYQSVAISVDRGWLGPRDHDLSVQIEKAKDFLSRNRVSTIIEATAPFLLDGFHKYAPSLASAAPDQLATRIDYTQHCIDIASELGSYGVSIHSGFKPSGLSFANAMELLVNNLKPISDYAADKGVRLAIEPTPGMLIDNTGRFERLLHLLASHDLWLTLDVGQLFCLSEVPISDFISRWNEKLLNVHLCDVKVGKPEHLCFGEGQIYLPPIVEALRSVDFQYGLHVDLDRHSHNAVHVVQASFAAVNPIITEVLADHS